MYLFVPCDKKSHGTEISFPIRSKRLSHPHPQRSGYSGNMAFSEYGKQYSRNNFCLNCFMK